MRKCSYESRECRAELDLQISLLNEQETTRLIELTGRLKVPTPADDELPQPAQNVDPQG
ncbi:hypothetical protein [Mesorhizobium sp.]|uniref:hypothetical protein n=1 Tax=Mesorhizobium sp. TaxID=1871066 RepID=UPI0025D1BBCC|nr:hypothetical protein [Mesorhizobium sp.]